MAFIVEMEFLLKGRRDAAPSPPRISPAATADFAGEPFQKWADRIKSDDGGQRMLTKEYEIVRAAPTPAICPAFSSNGPLNRYMNIHLIDETRVRLADGLPSPCSDYVHANWVDGYRVKREYILTQAPPGPAIQDYWRMIWQVKAQVLVCLTSLKERGASKADVYFPLNNETPFRAGPFRLVVSGVKEITGRRISIVHLKLYCWFGKTGAERNVAIVFYGEWPDRSVPTDAGAFLDLLGAVKSLRTTAAKSEKKTAETPPVVVNCSAGVGRSATFVACLVEIDRLCESGNVDPQGTVRRLRMQRHGAVQNYVQYTFICRVILEAAKRYGTKGNQGNKSLGTR